MITAFGAWLCYPSAHVLISESVHPSVRGYLGKKANKQKSRPNWPRKVREMKWAVGAKGLGLHRVPAGQGIGLQGPSVSRGWPTRSQGVKG